MFFQIKNFYLSNTKERSTILMLSLCHEYVIVVSSWAFIAYWNFPIRNSYQSNIKDHLEILMLTLCHVYIYMYMCYKLIGFYCLLKFSKKKSYQSNIKDQLEILMLILCHVYVYMLYTHGLYCLLEFSNKRYLSIKFYTIIDYWGIGHDVISTWEYKYWPRRSRGQYWKSQVDIISCPMPQ